MKLAGIIPEQTFLRNKLAQHLFLMFVLCALAPLAAMTAISYIRVNSQLSRQADERLREASKTAGMNLVERLSYLESDLDSLITGYSTNAEGNSWPGNEQVRSRLRTRYRGILLSSASGRELGRLGSINSPLQFSAEEIKHLSNGNPLVATRENTQGFQSVFLVKMGKLPDASAGLIIGEINPTYFWETDNIINSSAETLIVNQSMKVLYSSSQKQNPLTELGAALKKASSGRLEWGSGADGFIGGYWTIFMSPTFLDTWIIVQGENKDAVLEPMSSFRKTFFLIALLMFWVAALLSLTFIRRRMEPIEQLRAATQRVASKDFQARVQLSSKDEFGELGTAFNTMTQNLESYFNTIQTVNQIGKSLSIEEDQTKLLETILRGAKTLINADGAILCLVSETNQPILGLMQIDSLGMASRIDFSTETNRAESSLEKRMIASFLNSGTICCPDIYSADADHFNIQKIFDRRTGYRTRSLLSVPLVNHEGEGIGLMHLINAKDRNDNSVIPFSDEDVRLAESLASQAAVALSKNRLMTELILLFDGLTELIATAVDAKSSHTADHCKRVPALTMMLAEAACRATDGPFKDFSLSDDELHELRIAAMLHDCGKVATPVHIMDKSTKLETICDRIDLIDMRMEILRRDKLISLYRDRLTVLAGDAGSFHHQAIETALRKFIHQLDVDFNFLKECNSAVKSITSEDQKRIVEMEQKYCWLHRNGEQKPVLTADEVENLMVEEGTLTPRERAVINGHADLTIRMLQSLPLPKKLRNLPVHAGAHHERMDGRGYPQKLKGEQISIQGRIISIADIFEALTAANRPYKAARSMSEAVAILEIMKKEGQIDPDLFDLFVQEKLYLQYAKLFSNSGQAENSN